MKRIFLLFFFLFVYEVHAQQVPGQPASYGFTDALTATVQVSRVQFLGNGSGVSVHTFQWNTIGTVSGGACALESSPDGTSWTNRIAAQTVTASGGPPAAVSGNYNYIRINCTTAITGAGTVNVTYMPAGASGVGSSVAVTNTPLPVSFSSGTINQGAATSTTTVMQNAAGANGNGTVLATDGQATAVLTVGCSAVNATVINFETQNDGVNFTAQQATNLLDGTIGTSVTCNTTATRWLINVAGSKQARARISGFVAGTVTVTGTAVPLGGGGGGGGGGGAVSVTNSPTVQPGNTANTTAWLINQDAAKSVTTVMQNAAVADGNGTVLAVDGQAVVHLTLTCSVGACTLNVNFEGQNDGSNFVPVWANQDGTNTLATAAVYSTTAIGTNGWTIFNNGFKQLRARISGRTAGTMTVTGTTSPAAGIGSPIVNANITSTGGVALASDLGNVNDAAAAPGGTGTLIAKTRSISSQTDSIKTDLDTMNTAYTGSPLALRMRGTDGSAITATTDPCDGQIPLVKRYISVGSAQDESEVKNAAGTLCAIQARNANATTDAFVKCTNATAASTTPGSTAVYYDMIVPKGGGFVNAVIHAPFTTALTCYIVTGAADNNSTSVAASDVSYFLTYQ